MNKTKLLMSILVLFIFVCIFLWRGNGLTASSQLDSLSPMEITNLYYEAGSNGNVELLRRIIYFPPGTTEQQKQKRIDSCNLNHAPESKTILSVMGIKMKAQYEKIIDENTAEVGVVSKVGVLQSHPVEQIILKKDQGIWKYYDYKDNYASIFELAEAIKKHPEDASLYYYYGMHTISENPYQAHRYFKKYYELEPDGFWISEEILDKLKECETVNYFEKVMLGCDAPPGNKSGVYTKIGLAFAECMDYEKATQYYQKADDVIKNHPNPLSKERLEKAKKELKLRKEGKYIDLLDEIEKKQHN